LAKMHLAFLLEFYQPPTQDLRTLNTIITECYIPLGKLFNCGLNPQFTVSITHSLMSLLARYGRVDDVIPLLRTALQTGSIEIVHSGAYHPILPLLREEELVHQIERDFQLKQSEFGIIPRSGIISPELCYDDSLLTLFRGENFTWTVIDDGTMVSQGVPVPETHIYSVDGFFVFMRSSMWSNWVRDDKPWRTGREFVAALAHEAEARNEDCYKIIALCGETFGHHIKYYQETFLRDMLFALQGHRNVNLCKVSDLLNLLPNREKVPESGKDFRFFPRSSIATVIDDLKRGDPYPHWNSNGNAVHENLWKLTNLILDAYYGHSPDDAVRENSSLRSLLDEAFYSDQYYSASIWNWYPKPIYEGVDQQMRALYKYARLTRDVRTLEAGQRLYTRLMWTIAKQARDENRRTARRYEAY
jgi:hypothetical protein